MPSARQGKGTYTHLSYIHYSILFTLFIVYAIPWLYRYAMPNSRFLMARTGIEDGFQGQAIDISKAVKEVRYTRKICTSYLTLYIIVLHYIMSI